MKIMICKVHCPAVETVLVSVFVSVFVPVFVSVFMYMCLYPCTNRNLNIASSIIVINSKLLLQCYYFSAARFSLLPNFWRVA